MTGLDKILNQIEEEAKSSADKIIEEANAQAKEITEEAAAACRDMEETAAVKRQATSEDILKKSRSAAQMQRRQELLSAKQRIISEIIDKAQASLYTLGDKEYFELIARMLDKFALGEKGEIRFSKKDKERLPAGFDKTVAAAAAKNGGELTVSEQTCEIDGGFLLVYGGIEENCSFAAMFAAERENLQDKVHTLLFA